MAELSAPGALVAEATSTAPLLQGGRLALEQLRAIGWLRWRIFANGFRRKGGTGELVARILLWPLLLGLAVLPTVLAGAAAFYLASQGQLPHLAWVLWVAFGLTQLLNINLGQPGTTFDPVELIRFPIPLRRYVLVRLGFGVLSPANIVVSLISVAVAVGVTLADRRLWLPAAVVLTLFAVTNILFTRMLFAWVDRWLSTRRARELFTAVLFVGSLGFQYLNVRFNPGLQHSSARHPIHHQAPPFQRLRQMEHLVAWTPPELASHALDAAEAGQGSSFLLNAGACAAFAALFLAVYTARMRTEYQGENLSDAANATQPAHRDRPAAAEAPASATPVSTLEVSAPMPRQGRWPLSLMPLLGKELLVLRRNTGLFYGLVAPAVMVFLFAGRMAGRNGPHWVLFAAVGYSLLGISPLSYNSFGMEGTGAQLYFYAPVELREVFFAKNVFALLVAVLEILVVIGVVVYVAGRPSAADLLVVSFWSVGALLLNLVVGNLRSVAAPKQVKPGRAMNKAQSALSSYLAMGLLAGCALLGLAAELLAGLLHRGWLAVALSFVFAAAGVIAYVQGLRGIQAYALEHRDTFFEELGRKS